MPTAFLPITPLPLRCLHSRLSRLSRLSHRISTLRAVAKPPKPTPDSVSPSTLEALHRRKSAQIATPPPFTAATNPNTPPLTPETPEDDSPLSYIVPRLWLLVIAAIWGTNFATVKFIQSGVTPIPISTAALSRFSIAAVALLPFIPYELSKLGRRAFPPGFLLSSLAIGLPLGLGYFTQSVALSTTDASTSAFICSLGVVVVPILNRIIRSMGWGGDREQRSPISTWGAPLLAVLGVALLEFGGSPPTSGDAWALAQAVGFAGALIMNERVSARYPGLVFSQTSLQLVAVSVLSLLWATVDTSLTAGAFTYPTIYEAFADPTNATALFYTGLITTAMTVWVENCALVNVSSGEVAVLLSTEPFWAAWFSSIILYEHMGPQAVAGGAIILMACLVNQSGQIDFRNLRPLHTLRAWFTPKTPL